MTRHHSPRLAIAILNRCVRDQALIGDILEGSRDRSPAWLWRQVVLAALAAAAAPLRCGPRAVLEQALVGTAMLTLIGFSAAVVATLFSRVLVLADATWMADGGRDAPAQVLAAFAWFGAAVAVGRALAPLHRGHRVAAAAAYGVAASAAAFLHLYLFVPEATVQPLVSGAWQIATGTVFAAGLFTGIGWRFRCEPAKDSALDLSTPLAG